MKTNSLKILIIVVSFSCHAFTFDVLQTKNNKKDLTTESTKANLQEKVSLIFKMNCSVAGCHKGLYPKKKLNLEPDKFLDALINVPSSQLDSLKLVDTAIPEKSYLLMKINGVKGIVDARMPLDAARLKSEQIKIIEDWIFSLKEADKKEKSSQLKESKTKAQKVTTKRFRRPAFMGTQLMNIPTTKAIGKNELLFRISHRFFPTVRSGYDSFYGLNGPASILLSLSYGIRDNLSVTLGRNNLYRAFELSAKWLAFEQGEKFGLPLSAALIGGGVLVTQPGEKFFQSDYMKYNVQLSLSHQFNEVLSLIVMPAYSSNTNHWDFSPKGTFALGTGCKLSLVDSFALIGEYVRVLSGYYDNSDGWGLGIESKVGGHVFQIFLTNSLGMTTDQFLIGGDLELKNNDYRLGFNIFRTFWF